MQHPRNWMEVWWNTLMLTKLFHMLSVFAQVPGEDLNFISLVSVWGTGEIKDRSPLGIGTALAQLIVTFPWSVWRKLRCWGLKTSRSKWYVLIVVQTETSWIVIGDMKCKNSNGSNHSPNQDFAGLPRKSEWMEKQPQSSQNEPKQVCFPDECIWYWGLLVQYISEAALPYSFAHYWLYWEWSGRIEESHHCLRHEGKSNCSEVKVFKVKSITENRTDNRTHLKTWWFNETVCNNVAASPAVHSNTCDLQFYMLILWRLNSGVKW